MGGIEVANFELLKPTTAFQETFCGNIAINTICFYIYFLPIKFALKINDIFIYFVNYYCWFLLMYYRTLDKRHATASFSSCASKTICIFTPMLFLVQTTKSHSRRSRQLHVALEPQFPNIQEGVHKTPGRVWLCWQIKQVLLSLRPSVISWLTSSSIWVDVCSFTATVSPSPQQRIYLSTWKSPVETALMFPRCAPVSRWAVRAAARWSLLQPPRTPRRHEAAGLR